MRLDFGLVSPWVGIIDLPLGAGNERIHQSFRAFWTELDGGRWRVSSERLYPPVDLLAPEPHKTVNLQTRDSSLPGPGVESRGFDVQLAGEFVDGQQHRCSLIELSVRRTRVSIIQTLRLPPTRWVSGVGCLSIAVYRNGSPSMSNLPRWTTTNQYAPPPNRAATSLRKYVS